MITQDIRRVETAAGHIFRAVRRAIGKVLLWFVVGLGVGGGAVEGVGFFNNNMHAPTVLTHIAAGAFGLVLAYAAALTTAVGEAIRALIDAGKDVEQGAVKVEQAVTGDIGKVAAGGEGVLGGVLKSVEQGAQRLEGH